MIQHAYGAAAVSACLAPVGAALDEPAPDKSGFTIFNPTPGPLMRPMSTDRPDTTESPYTVDAGHFQVEASVADYTQDSEDGQAVRVWAIAPMLLKVGLLNNVDLQLGLDPYINARATADDGTGTERTTEGFGDTTVRVKINLWGNDAGGTAFALMPFVVLPTATDGLGAGHVEGGLIAPLAVELPAGFGLGLMAEIDFIRSQTDDRYVADLVYSATVGRDLVGDLGAYVEFAGFHSLSADRDYRGFFNTGLTYSLTPDAQLDAGVRIGLTSAADDFGVFAGVSFRY